MRPGTRYVRTVAGSHPGAEETPMGKGDKRTKRGKIYAGSYGNTRPQGSSKSEPAPAKGKK
jgi:30S ribosomal protein S31